MTEANLVGNGVLAVHPVVEQCNVRDRLIMTEGAVVHVEVHLDIAGLEGSRPFFVLLRDECTADSGMRLDHGEARRALHAVRRS